MDDIKWIKIGHVNESCQRDGGEGDALEGVRLLIFKARGDCNHRAEQALMDAVDAIRAMKEGD
jgi:hypothetical protein